MLIPDDDIKQYFPNTKHKIISKIIASFVKKYHFDFDVKFACLNEQNANPVLYVFLLPFVSNDNFYLIKIGYTKNLIVRYDELKKEFNVDYIYLIYAFQIDGEHIELDVHKELKKLFSTNIYRMKKNKNEKVENKSISEETYKFNWSVFSNIIHIIYSKYILMDKKFFITKETEKAMHESDKAKYESDKAKYESDKAKYDCEIVKSNNEIKGKEIDVKGKEIELQILLTKLKILELEKK